MGIAHVSLNTTLKVNRAINGGETVGAGCYAVVTYISSESNGSGNFIDCFTRYFGPGQLITSNFGIYHNPGGTPYYNYYNVVSGVEFINSP